MATTKRPHPWQACILGRPRGKSTKIRVARTDVPKPQALPGGCGEKITVEAHGHREAVALARRAYARRGKLGRMTRATQKALGACVGAVCELGAPDAVHRASAAHSLEDTKHHAALAVKEASAGKCALAFDALLVARGALAEAEAHATSIEARGSLKPTESSAHGEFEAAKENFARHCLK